MPAAIKTARDERLWKKAKKAAAESGKSADYAYVMGIYKKMKGKACDCESCEDCKIEKAQAQLDLFGAKQDTGRPQRRHKGGKRTPPGQLDLFGARVKPKKTKKRSGGPYIGPRGGKWADPQHKIAWKEDKPEKTKKTKTKQQTGLPGEKGSKEHEKARAKVQRKEAFKRWFGDSKVVRKDGTADEQYGSAVKVFHGTPVGGFSSFDPKKDKGYNIFGKGFYFTEDRGIAEEYTKKDKDDALAGTRGFADAQGNPIPQLTAAQAKKLLASFGYHHEGRAGTKWKDWGEEGAKYEDHPRRQSHQGSNPNWSPNVLHAVAEASDDKGRVNIEKMIDTFWEPQRAALEKQDAQPPGMRYRLKTNMSSQGGKRLFSAVRKVLGKGAQAVVPGSQVFEVYLSVKKPVDMDAPVTREEFASISKFTAQKEVERATRSVADYVKGQKIMRDLIAEYEFLGEPWEGALQNQRERLSDNIKYQALEKIRLEETKLAVSGKTSPKIYGAYLDDLVGGELSHEDVTGKDYSVPHSFEDYEKLREHIKESTRGQKYNGRQISAAMHISSGENMTWQELHWMMSNGHSSRGTRNEFTEWAKSEGYDGIKHTGGWNIGTKEHDVWIAFESTQIKATTSEAFDKKNVDIYKAQQIDLFGAKTNTGRPQRGKTKQTAPGQLDLFGARMKTKKTKKRSGGPYIGPRGGKWADPQHKIAWKEDKPEKATEQKRIKRGRSPLAHLVASELQYAVRKHRSTHGALEAVKRSLKDLRAKIKERGGLKEWQKYAGDWEKRELKDLKESVKSRQKDTQWVLSRRELDALQKKARAAKTDEDAKKLAQDYKDYLNPSFQGFVMGQRPPKPQDKIHFEALQAAENTALRKPTTTDLEEIAKMHGLSAVKINPEMGKKAVVDVSGMISNALEDLNEALGGVSKPGYEGLQIRVTGTESIWAAGYDWGAKYSYAGGLKPKRSGYITDEAYTRALAARWDKDWTEGEPKQRKPPIIYLDTDNAHALAHEIGHAIDHSLMHLPEEEGDKVRPSKQKILSLLRGGASSKRAATADEERRKKRGESRAEMSYYWSTPAEQWARAFEQYVHKKLHEKGKVNSMLTHGGYDSKVYDGVYHSPEEFKPIEKAFDEFINAAQKHGVLKKSIMYLFDGGGVSLFTDWFEKAKYCRKTPTGKTTKRGKPLYRYYYRDSKGKCTTAAARGAKEGEQIKAGEHTLNIHKIEEDGTIHVEHSQHGSLKYSHEEWQAEMVKHFGDRYLEAADKRARQALGAVLRVVPKDMLEDLKGSTDKERLEDLQKRAPEVFEKLEKSFRRAGVSMDEAKRIVSSMLERQGWSAEARATMLGEVTTRKGASVARNWRRVSAAAESLAGGAEVQPGHVQGAVDAHKVVQSRSKYKALAEAAESEMETLKKAIEAASKDPSKAHEVLESMLKSPKLSEFAALLRAFPGVGDKAREEVADLSGEAVAVTHQEPTRHGAHTDVYVAGEGGAPKAVKARYVLVESDEITPSHNPLTFSANESYPEGWQERNYHNDEVEKNKVLRNADRFLPAVVANTNPDAVNGAPMVLPDGTVLGGNSRTMSMQLIYGQDQRSAKAKELRTYLKEQASQFGFRAEDVEALKNPILVRVVEPEDKSEDNMKLLVRQMNESFTGGMDPRTWAVAVSRRLDEKALSAAMAQMQPGETLTAFLGSGRAKDFTNALERVGIIDERNANVYKNKKGTTGAGKLNEDGKRLVERILLAKLVGDADLLSSTQSQTVSSVARSIPHIFNAEGEGKGYSLRESIKTALQAKAQLERLGDKGTIDKLTPKTEEGAYTDIVASSFKGDIFRPDHPVIGDARASALLKLMIYKPTHGQFSKVLRTYSERASKNNELQSDMGTGADAKKTPEEILTSVIAEALGGKKTEEKKTEEKKTEEKKTEEKKTEEKKTESEGMRKWNEKYKDRAKNIENVGGHAVFELGGKHYVRTPEGKNAKGFDSRARAIADAKKREA